MTCSDLDAVKEAGYQVSEDVARLNSSKKLRVRKETLVEFKARIDAQNKEWQKEREVYDLAHSGKKVTVKTEVLEQRLRQLSGNPETLKGNPALAVINNPEKLKKLQKAVGIKGNKYHAIRTWSELCQRTFDSKAEARRGEDLAFLLKANQIEDLRYQISFKLCKEPQITVTLDFTYLDKNIGRIYEDVKGVLTRDSRTKYAWLKQLHGVDVRLVK